MTSTNLAKYGIKELHWWYRISNGFNQYQDIETRNKAFRHVSRMLLIYKGRVSDKVIIKAFHIVQSYFNDYCKQYNHEDLMFKVVC